ncbi:MAG: hypothetical protein ACE5GO_08955, partial [Anaerolineales bacterium]
TWWTGLYQSGALFQAASGENWWSSIAEAMDSGQIAYWLAFADEQTEFGNRPEEPPAFQIGIAPLPVMPASSHLDTRVKEHGFSISRASPNVSACWEWGKFLSVQPTVLRGVPARQSTAASPDWEASVGPENAAVYRLALERVSRVEEQTHLGWILQPYNSWLGQAEDDVLDGIAPDVALAQAQYKADLYQACMLTEDLSRLTEPEIRAKVTSCAQQADPDW